MLVYRPIDLAALLTFTFFMSFMICVGSFVDGRGEFRLFRSFAYGHFAALSLVAIFHAPLMALSTLAGPTNSLTHESTRTRANNPHSYARTYTHTHTGICTHVKARRHYTLINCSDCTSIAFSLPFRFLCLLLPLLPLLLLHFACVPS